MKSSKTSSLIDFLLVLMQEVTGLNSEHLDKKTRFDEIGLQSLSVVAFTRRLTAFFPQLPPTFLYDCGNISEVAAYLEDRYGPDHVQAVLDGRTAGEPEAAPPSCSLQEHRDDPGAPSGRPQEHRANPQERADDFEWPELQPLTIAPEASAELPAAPESSSIAVIGMHGRFPDAPDLETFWNNLAAGVDSVREIPADRWPLEDFYEPSEGQRKPGRSYSKWGGFVADVDRFDAQFFGVAAREAALTDPQERLLLECAWHAMESAALLGERGAALKGADGYGIGVFVGLTTNTYALLGPDRWRQGDPEIPASMPWSAANRISYCLDLAGPSLTIDTACSSSLVALHLACESLLERECDAALAGAANLYLHPAKYIQLCQQQMLSPSGRCNSFGEAADGFAPGEGVGVVVLKRLADAKKDGDRILAVIKGTAVNHNGRSNGYTVPKARSQASLISAAMERAGVPPERIGFVEAHGTGTKLGDPIEVAGLTEVLGARDEAPPCAIASVKSNIGHLESAAGMASLIKTILQLRHKRIAPSLHATPRNPALELERTRFFVPEEPQNWPRPAAGGLRAAGVSSFGAGGTNGHVVVEEAPPHQNSNAEGPMVFPLSARSAEQLETLAESALHRLTDGMADSGDETYLGRLAFTLQCGLRHLEHRLCLIGATVDELASQLRDFLSGSEQARTGQAPPYRGIATLGIEEGGSETGRNDRELARAFVAGKPIAWRDEWRGEPIPVEPPHYPFARDRHWLKPLEAEPILPASAGEEDQVPSLEEHFCRIPHGSSLVGDHRIGGRPLVPGTAYLGYCLDTVSHLLDGAPIILSDVEWLRPIAADDASGEIGLRILVSHQGDRLAFELEDVSAPGETCFKGNATRNEPPSSTPPGSDAPPALEEAREACSEPVDVATCYARFGDAGMVYGPRFRPLTNVWRGEGRFLAEIARQPYGSGAGEHEPELDPALLDGALHAASALVDEADLETPLVPASLGAFRLHGALNDELFSYGIERPAGPKGEKHFDVYLFAPDGTLLAEFADLRFRRAPSLIKQAPVAQSLHLLQPEWVARPLAAPAASAGLTVLFDADDILFRKLKDTEPQWAAKLRLVTPGSGFEVRGEDQIVWDPSSEAHTALPVANPSGGERHYRQACLQHRRRRRFPQRPLPR